MRHAPTPSPSGEETESRERPPSVAVIGAGIAGIQAALDLANGGVHVTLVEKGDVIGGRMAQTDKTFPTLDCSSCTLTPRTVEVSSHPLIRLLTRAELTALEGEGGAYRLRLRLHPRHVDPEACVSCGRCAEACRLAGRVPRPFDLGLAKGSAIDLPFPQAIPSAYAVDPGACLYLTRGKCGRGPKCVEACEVGAIHLDEPAQEEVLEADAVIVATGYELYDPSAPKVGRPELGYGLYPEVLTNLQFERLSSASGPTGGTILVNGQEPRQIVFLQCVGSRDATTGARYCSRVCCMASLKQAVLCREKIPGAEVTILYMDLRAFGKGYEEFQERAQRMGVLLRRGNPSEVYRREGKLVVRFEDTLLGRVEELPADLVVLAAGIRPGRHTSGLSEILGVPVHDADGFFAGAEPRDPVLTARPGLFTAGTCTGPMDIPDAVASGSAAAAAALAHLFEGRGRRAATHGT